MSNSKPMSKGEWEAQRRAVAQKAKVDEAKRREDRKESEAQKKSLVKRPGKR